MEFRNSSPTAAFLVLPASKRSAALVRHACKRAARFGARIASNAVRKHWTTGRSKTTPALPDGPNAPSALQAPRTMSEGAKKETGRDKKKKELSAQIQQLVNGYKAGGQDSHSPKLMGLLDAVDEIVAQLNGAINVDHMTKDVSTFII